MQLDTIHSELWPNAESAKDPNREKVVLLHGLGGVGKLWRPIAANLESDMSVMAPDQRGHGKSRLTLNEINELSFRPADYGADVKKLMEQMQFHPAWVVGHSMGVRTSIALANLAPEFVKGLVLIDLSPNTDRGISRLSGGRSLKDFLEILPPTFETREAARIYMDHHCPDASIGQYLMAVIQPAGRGKEVVFPFDSHSLIKTIDDAARVPSLLGELKKAAATSIPILFLRGALSRIWNEEEYKQDRELMKGFSNVTFEEFAGAGHGLPFEKRPEFIARLRKFIGGN